MRPIYPSFGTRESEVQNSISSDQPIHNGRQWIKLGAVGRYRPIR